MAEQDETDESSDGTGPLAYLLYGLTGLVAVAWTTETLHNSLAVRWAFAYLVAINLVALGFYVYDKVFVKLLKALAMRVPERLLIWGFAFPGGWVGALAAMTLVNHKTGPKTADFRVTLFTASVLSITLLGVLLLVMTERSVPSLGQIDTFVERLATLVMSAFGAVLETVKAL